MARNILIYLFFRCYDFIRHLKDPTSIKSNDFAKNVNLDFTSNDRYKVGVTEDFDIFLCSNEIKDMTNNTFKLIKSLGHKRKTHTFQICMMLKKLFKYLELIFFIILMVFVRKIKKMLSKILYGI